MILELTQYAESEGLGSCSWFALGLCYKPCRMESDRLRYLNSVAQLIWCALESYVRDFTPQGMLGAAMHALGVARPRRYATRLVAVAQ